MSSYVCFGRYSGGCGREHPDLPHAAACLGRHYRHAAACNGRVDREIVGLDDQRHRRELTVEEAQTLAALMKEIWD